MDQVTSSARRLNLDASQSRDESRQEIPYEYRYQRIPDENVVRILTLGPGRWDDRLVGSLDFVDLEEDPEYEAISYTWGDPLRCREMLLDGKVFPLTQSLSDALRTVRLVDRPRKLWADQICINQRQPKERSQQVTLMNAVYKKTQKVLIFIGNDKDKIAEKAFDVVVQLDQIFKDKEKLKNFTQIQQQGGDILPAHDWKNFKQLCRAPYVRLQSILRLSVNVYSLAEYGSHRR